MSSQYWVETVGCPKNRVDSDELGGPLAAGGSTRARAVAIALAGFVALTGSVAG